MALFSFEGYKVKLCKEGIEVPGVKDSQWSVHITSPLATPTATCFPRSMKQQEGLRRSDRKAIIFKNSDFLILKVEGIERLQVTKLGCFDQFSLFFFVHIGSRQKHL